MSLPLSGRWKSVNNDPYSLDKLHDLVEPAAVAWWPLAPGWWIVIALLLVWLGAAFVTAWIRWRKTAYRRAGLRLLDKIEKASANASADSVRLLGSLSSLLKRVALAAFPRERVASLSGDEWIAFLDRTSAGARFATEPMNLLAGASYHDSASAQLDDEQFSAICDAARSWIQTHDTELDKC